MACQQVPDKELGYVNLEADPQPGVHKGERGTPGKRAQAAAGRKAEQPTEVVLPPQRSYGGRTTKEKTSSIPS